MVCKIYKTKLITAQETKTVKFIRRNLNNWKVVINSTSYKLYPIGSTHNKNIELYNLNCKLIATYYFSENKVKINGLQ